MSRLNEGMSLDEALNAIVEESSESKIALEKYREVCGDDGLNVLLGFFDDYAIYGQDGATFLNVMCKGDESLVNLFLWQWMQGPDQKSISLGPAETHYLIGRKETLTDLEYKVLWEEYEQWCEYGQSSQASAMAFE